MARRPRRNHAAVVKVKMAPGALKRDKTLVYLAAQFDDPAAVAGWFRRSVLPWREHR